MASGNGRQGFALPSASTVARVIPKIDLTLRGALFVRNCIDGSGDEKCTTDALGLVKSWAGMSGGVFTWMHGMAFDAISDFLRHYMKALPIATCAIDDPDSAQDCLSG